MAIITGNTTFSNFLDGTPEDDIMTGGNRRDTLRGRGGNDTLYGGFFYDNLFGGIGNDVLYGGDYQDQLNGDQGNDQLFGGDGNDHLLNSEGADFLDGGAGNDNFFFLNRDGTVDTITGGSGVDQFWLGMPTNSRFEIGSLPGLDVITDFQAGVGGDFINMGSVLSSLIGLFGNDPFTTGFLRFRVEGEDAILQVDRDGSASTYTWISLIRFENLNPEDLRLDNFTESVSPNSVGVTINGNFWAESLSGSSKNDTIYGNGGRDTISGRQGDDALFGGTENDIIYGGVGKDNINGDSEADTLFGEDGDDSLFGGIGNDSLYGGADDDTLNGGDNDDFLSGGYGADIINGNAGNDTFEDIYRDATVDLLTGGTGIDTFRIGLPISDAFAIPSRSGLDVVTDFQAGIGGDLIDLSYVLLSLIGLNGRDPFDADFLRFAQDGTDAVLVVDRDGAGAAHDWSALIKFQNLNVANLRLDNFTNGFSPNDIGLTITGTNNGETLNGSIKNDTISGLGGNDVLNGGDGNDILNGGDNDDTLNGGAGADILNGNAGNDNFGTIARDGTRDQITGGTGSDYFKVGMPISNTFAVAGTLGIDIITDFQVGAGGDRLDLSSVLSSLIGLGEGNPFLGGFLRFQKAGTDAILQVDRDGAGAAHDWVSLVRFDDFTASNLVLANLVDGFTLDGAGVTLVGNSTNQTLTGTLGNDSLSGEGGNDTLNGLQGSDTLFGGDGNDTLNGGAGVDSLDGGADSDTLLGLGEDGSIDQFTGGASIDTFVASDASFNINTTIGVDVVNDFQPGIGGDRLDLAALYNRFSGLGSNNPFVEGYLRFVVVGSDARLEVDYDGAAAGRTWQALALFKGLNPLDLGSANFVQGFSPDDTPNPIYGTALNDNITGTNRNDIIEALGGNDQVSANAGNDTIYGGSGIDTISGNDGDDIVYGGAGNDFIRGENGSLSSLGGNDTLQGDDGDDSIVGEGGDDVLGGGSGSDQLEGGWGNDTIDAGADDDRAYGGPGNDQINGGDGLNDLYGEEGNDVFLFSTTNAATNFSRVNGGNGTDTIRATADNVAIGLIQVSNVEVISAGGFAGVVVSGNDDPNSFDFSGTQFSGISGVLLGDGNDSVIGSAARDRVSGEAGNDTIDGRGGNDILQGDAGADILVGGDGNDQLDGGADVDRLFGGAGDDAFIFDGTADRFVETINGGNDWVWATADYALADDGNIENLLLRGAAVTGTGNLQDNQIVGGDLDNVLSGLDGDDVINGYAGDDSLFGGNGMDRLFGNAGNDALYGGADNDRLAGGEGSDTLDGGAGVDWFRYFGTGLNNGDVKAGDRDVIIGEAGERLDFSGGVEAVLVYNGVNLATSASNVLIGGATFSATSNLRFDAATQELQIDLNGDQLFNAAQDFAVSMAGLSSLTYNAAGDYFLLG